MKNRVEDRCRVWMPKALISLKIPYRWYGSVHEYVIRHTLAALLSKNAETIIRISKGMGDI